MRMRFLVGVAAWLVATQAAAGPVSVSGCRLESEEIMTLVYCQTRNDGSVAVDTLRYGIVIREDGRTVPWAERGSDGSSDRLFSSIGGGIEPGETVDVMFRAPHIPERADRAKLIIEVTILEARDVNGEPIN
jgi:hypothetical protein